MAVSNKGFLDSIGINSFDEIGAIRRVMPDEGRSSSRAGDLANVGRSIGSHIGPAVGGLIGGLKGLAKGDSAEEGGTGTGGRSFKEFGRDVAETMTRGRDETIAKGMGLPGGAAEVQAKRKTFKEISQALRGITQDGSIASRKAVANKVAEISLQNGDATTHDKAMQQIAELDREALEDKKLGIEVSDAERASQIEEEVGFEARHIDDKEGTRGRAVRINEGPDAGRYKLYRPGQEPLIVEGGELIKPNAIVTAASRAGKLKDSESLAGLAKMNGATPGKIGQLRGQLTSMEQNAQIVSNIATNLSSLSDPQAALDLSGKGAIVADKTVSFVESVTGLFTSFDDDTKTTYNGKPVSTGKQRSEFIRAGTEGGIEAFAKESGFASARDMLPEHLQDNAVAAEQYWANIMELAYLDARLKEPSNRGLSDNDIQNALKRIGADTANPVSFAVRQLEVINTSLLPSLENLGSEFTNFGSPHFNREQISQTVYSPELKNRVRSKLQGTAEELEAFIAGGRRGQGDGAGSGANTPPAQPTADDPFAGKTLEELIAEREALGE